jgi:hypothetical protein
MFARVYGNVKVRVRLRSADPSAIQTKSRGRPRIAEKPRIILKHIDEGFTRIGFSEGMLGAIGLYIELDVWIAASGGRGSLDWRSLPECGCGEAEQENGQGDSHVGRLLIAKASGVVAVKPVVMSIDGKGRSEVAAGYRGAPSLVDWASPPEELMETVLNLQPPSLTVAEV